MDTRAVCAAAHRCWLQSAGPQCQHHQTGRICVTGCTRRGVVGPPAVEVLSGSQPGGAAICSRPLIDRIQRRHRERCRVGVGPGVAGVVRFAAGDCSVRPVGHEGAVCALLSPEPGHGLAWNSGAGRVQCEDCQTLPENAVIAGVLGAEQTRIGAGRHRCGRNAVSGGGRDRSRRNGGQAYCQPHHGYACDSTSEGRPTRLRLRTQVRAGRCGGQFRHCDYFLWRSVTQRRSQPTRAFSGLRPVLLDGRMEPLAATRHFDSSRNGGVPSGLLWRSHHNIATYDCGSAPDCHRLPLVRAFARVRRLATNASGTHLETTTETLVISRWACPVRSG
jgi:hypothetical protein